jgi:hypothetical protein
MFFFDYLHYSIYKFYAGFGEKGALSSAAGIVGGFQAANVMTLILLFFLTQKEKMKIDKLVVIALFIVFQVYTYIRYVYKESHSISVIEQGWLGKTPGYRKGMSVFLFIYGAVSVIALLSLAVYLGSRK